MTSYAKASDVRTFGLKAMIYERKEGKRPQRLLMVTPYADKAAFKAAEELGGELYTKV